MALRNKKQHFVPDSYLQAWIDPECPPGEKPYVWRFDKDGGHGRRKPPSKLFHEQEMYTRRGPNGERDLTIEDGLSQFERGFVKSRNKLRSHTPLSDEDMAMLSRFVAAAQARTPQIREHWRSQWKGALDMGDELLAHMNRLSPEEREKAAHIYSGPSAPQGPTIDHEELRKVVEEPLQHMLVPVIEQVARVLPHMDLLVIETTDPVGFITSDNPCVWFDAEAHKRGPYRGLGLAYKSIEISMPLSPEQMIIFNWRNMTGYKAVPLQTVQQMNRRQLYHSHESIVVCMNRFDQDWLIQGIK